MPNSYFQFKQFTVQQDKCAMKVCTDACLFGATVASRYPAVINCLDIGAGTGLLSLMLAQHDRRVVIDAVEIDFGAASQADENFTASPWTERLNVFNTDIRSFEPGKKYDLIISNPPFFEDDLRSGDQRKNQAKHDTGLSLAELVAMAEKNIAADGILAVLLPHHRVEYFIEEAVNKGFHLNEKILIKQSSTHNYFRGILFLGRKKTGVNESVISIKDDNNRYTAEFIALLKDYYLYL